MRHSYQGDKGRRPSIPLCMTLYQRANIANHSPVHHTYLPHDIAALDPGDGLTEPKAVPDGAAGGVAIPARPEARHVSTSQRSMVAALMTPESTAPGPLQAQSPARPAALACEFSLTSTGCWRWVPSASG